MRVDDDEIYIPPKPKERSSFEWLGIITLAIVLGTFLTDGIRILAANAWMNHQLEQAAKELHSQKAEARKIAETRQNQLRAEAEERKMNSYECRFWWEQYQLSPTAKNEAMKMHSCKL